MQAHIEASYRALAESYTVLRPDRVNRPSALGLNSSVGVGVQF